MELKKPRRENKVPRAFFERLFFEGLAPGDVTDGNVEADRVMRSKLLARTTFDVEDVRDEISSLLEEDVPEHYSDFVFGTWKSYALYNGTGNGDDSVLKEFEGPARPTPLAERLERIRNLIESNFNLAHLRWARAFVLRTGVLRHIAISWS